MRGSSGDAARWDALSAPPLFLSLWDRGRMGGRKMRCRAYLGLSPALSSALCWRFVAGRGEWGVGVSWTALPVLPFSLPIVPYPRPHFPLSSPLSSLILALIFPHTRPYPSLSPLSFPNLTLILPYPPLSSPLSSPNLALSTKGSLSPLCHRVGR